MKPDSKGPRTGPMNGAADQIIMGLGISYAHAFTKVVQYCVSTEGMTHVPTLSFGKTSEIAPPDTDRNADPANPDRNRKTRRIAMWLPGCQEEGVWEEGLVR